jgi:hypothetical protein
MFKKSYDSVDKIVRFVYNISDTENYTFEMKQKGSCYVYYCNRIKSESWKIFDAC